MKKYWSPIVITIVLVAALVIGSLALARTYEAPKMYGALPTPTPAVLQGTTANITGILGVYSGTANITAGNGAVIVSLAMSGTPSIIELAFDGNPGDSASTLYTLPATNNSSAFEIYATTNVTNNVAIAYRVTVGTGK